MYFWELQGGTRRICSFHFESTCKDRVVFEIINTDNMKRDPFKFGPEELFDWLFAADIHLLVGHLQQGNDH